jgi:hypothetical protein
MITFWYVWVSNLDNCKISGHSRNNLCLYLVYFYEPPGIIFPPNKIGKTSYNTNLQKYRKLHKTTHKC